MKDHIYALSPEASLFIGKRNLGHISNYYLGEPINDDEVADVQAAAEKIGVDVLNTRFYFFYVSTYSFSTEENRVVKNGPNDFTLLVASAQTQVHASHEIDTKQGDKAKLKVQYGDFSADLLKVVNALEKVCWLFLIPFLTLNNLLLGEIICCKRQPNENDRGLH